MATSKHQCAARKRGNTRWFFQIGSQVTGAGTNSTASAQINVHPFHIGRGSCVVGKYRPGYSQDNVIICRSDGTDIHVPCQFGHPDLTGGSSTNISSRTDFKFQQTHFTNTTTGGNQNNTQCRVNIRCRGVVAIHNRARSFKFYCAGGGCDHIGAEVTRLFFQPDGTIGGRGNFLIGTVVDFNTVSSANVTSRGCHGDAGGTKHIGPGAITIGETTLRNQRHR